MDMTAWPALIVVAALLVAAVGALLAWLDRRQMPRDFGLQEADRLSRHFQQASRGFEPTQMQ